MSRLGCPRRMTAKGHGDQFPPPTLSVRRRFGEATFAETLGNGRDAPIPDLPALALERAGSTQSSHSLQATLWSAA
jgi:hypothetical protein